MVLSSSHKSWLDCDSARNLEPLGLGSFEKRPAKPLTTCSLHLCSPNFKRVIDCDQSDKDGAPIQSIFLFQFCIIALIFLLHECAYYRYNVFFHGC